MKTLSIKSIIVGICVVALGVGAWFWLKRSNDTELSYALAHEFGDYVNAHDNYPPGSWEEFMQWAGTRHFSHLWTLADLQQRFAIGSHEKVSGRESETVLVVLAPNLKRLEPELNREILRIALAGRQRH